MEEVRIEAEVAPIVVLNVSNYRCDALIIESAVGVTNLRLPELALGGIKRKVLDLKSPSRIASALEWLWNTVARDVLAKMGFTSAVKAKEAPRYSGSFRVLLVIC